MNSEKREEEDDEAATQGEGREKVTGPRRDPAPTSARRLGLKENTRHIYPIPYLLRLQSMAYARSLSLECPSTNAPWRRGSSCLTCAVGGHPPPPRATTIKGDLARKSKRPRGDQASTRAIYFICRRGPISRRSACRLPAPHSLLASSDATRQRKYHMGGGRGGRGGGGRRGVQTSPGPPRLHVAMQHV